MDTLLARLTDLAYEFFGILLPGVIALLALILFWIALGDLAPSNEDAPLGRAVKDIWVALKGGTSIPWSWGVLAIAASYFLGHLLKWLSKQWWWCWQRRSPVLRRMDFVINSELKATVEAFNAGRYGEAYRLAKQLADQDNQVDAIKSEATKMLAKIQEIADTHSGQISALGGTRWHDFLTGRRRLRKLADRLEWGFAFFDGSEYVATWEEELKTKQGQEDFQKAVKQTTWRKARERIWTRLAWLFRLVLIAPKQPRDNFSKSLTELVAWLADVYRERGGYNRTLAWNDLFPVARACILQRGRKSLLLTFQSNYTLHRSLATLATAFLWASPIALVWGCAREVSPSVQGMLSFIGVSFIAKQIFTANYKYFWSKWGEHMVAEAYALELDREPARQS